jgi:soluble P-type ATPase
MIRIEIPGRAALEIQHLVLDLNGTLATDGSVPPQVAERLRARSAAVDVHVITADTFGTADTLGHLGVRIVRLAPGDHVIAKGQAVRTLGPDRIAAIGNGMNDAAMVQEAALGIIVGGREGAAVQSLLAADVAVTSIEDGLDLLLRPKRLTASLRTR